MNSDGVALAFSKLVGEIVASHVSPETVTVDCSKNSRKSQSSIAS